MPSTPSAPRTPSVLTAGRSVLAFAPLAFVFALGCSPGGSANDPDAPVNGGGLDGDNGSGDGEGGNGGGGAPPTVTAHSLYPVTATSSWTYDFVPLDATRDGSDDTGEELELRHEERVTAVRVVEEYPAQTYPIQYMMDVRFLQFGQDVLDGLGTDGFVAHAGDDEVIIQRTTFSPATEIKGPVEVGRTWDSSSGSSWLNHREEITVPAGTFRDCWTAKTQFQSIDAAAVYCPGVGPVHRILQDFGHGIGRVEMRLVSYTP